MPGLYPIPALTTLPSYFGNGLSIAEDNGFDLTGYDLGTVRTLADYEAYAGVNFKDMSVQKYTLENGYPPTPQDSPWSKSFYHLVTVHRHELPADDYKSILIAFDDTSTVKLITISPFDVYFCKMFL